jgi:hypothetical protein
VDSQTAAKEKGRRRMNIQRKKGDRVYALLVHEQTGEERKRWGTVASDEIEFWDYTDVRFDDLPNFIQPVVSWYLFDADDEGGGD